MSSLDKLRIFCVDCQKIATIHWYGKSPDAWPFTLIHLECHGHHTMAVLPPPIISRLETHTRPHVDVFLSDLDPMSTGELDQLEANIETEMLRHSTFLDIVRRVRRS